MRKVRRGFTLLEVLIATGILGGALVALLSSVSHSTRMERRACALLHQSTMARNKMTEILANPELDDGDSDSGDFEGASYFSWKSEVEKVVLPFDEEAITERKGELLKITLDVKDSRFNKTMTFVEYRPKGKKK